MERIDDREVIEKIIQQHATEGNKSDGAADQVVFDCAARTLRERSRDSYLLLSVGWDDEERIYGCSIHIDIKDEKIWIQQDFTEEGIANQLVEFGVPKTDIILGFRAPVVRQFTGFAVA